MSAPRSPDPEMTTAPAGTKLTYADYCAIPEDGRRHEIIDGEHVISPAPTVRHQDILKLLSRALFALEDEGRARVYFAPIDVHLGEHDIVQPDLIAVATTNAAVVGERKVNGPPDLVVEVLSPSTRRSDRGAKRALYELSGVREYWIVDPGDDTIAQLTLEERAQRRRFAERVHEAGTVESTAFPDFALDVAAVFATP